MRRLASLPSQPSTLSSMKSGITLRYEEFEAAFAAATGEFRSVIDVEPGSAAPDEYKSVVTVEADAEAVPVAQDVNVIVENNQELESENSQDVTRITIDSVEQTEEKPETSARSRSQPERAEEFLEDIPQPPLGVPPFFLPPHSRLLPPPSHFGPLPPLLLGPPRPPWVPPPPPQGLVEAAATPPVELTRLRFNQSFDTNPGEPLFEGGGRNFSRRSAPELNHQHPHRELYGGNVLRPEELPRIFPGPMIPTPFQRVEDEFSEGDDMMKDCCGGWRISQVTLLRWFIGIISLVGMACVVVGIVLGALTVSGTTRLTLCLLMIGVGAILITVSGVAWRLTSVNPNSTTSCWSIFGCSNTNNQDSFHTGNPYLRVRSHNGRFLHPFSGFLYPEFAWRPPPPSYQASVREEQLQQFFDSRPSLSTIPAPSGSPPPTYRVQHRELHRNNLMDDINPQEASRPPSYRSHESIPEILVEERPFSRQETTEIEVENNDQNSSNSTPSPNEGVVTVSTETISVDDRQRENPEIT